MYNLHSVHFNHILSAQASSGFCLCSVDHHLMCIAIKDKYRYQMVLHLHMFTTIVNSVVDHT